VAYGLDVGVADLAKVLGIQSTGGVYAFQKGGFNVSGGFKIKRGKASERQVPLIPPLILHVDFPEKWRFLVVRPFQAPASPDGEGEEEKLKKLQLRRPPRRLIHEAYFTLMSNWFHQSWRRMLKPSERR